MSNIPSVDNTAEAFGLNYFAQSDIGLRREENQDSYGLISKNGYCFFLVADGMGGVKGGAVASNLAIKVVHDCLQQKEEVAVADIVSAVSHANRAVFEQGVDQPELSGMGTTLVGICFQQGQILVVNVGDSRAYRFRSGGIEQLTEDHTLVGELLRSGAINESQVKNHPVSHMLTRSLGPTPAVDIDCCFYAEPPRIGDQYLLCSDGLYNLVSDTEIAAVLSGNKVPAAVQQLVDLANARGGTDNVTIIAVEVAENFQEVPALEPVEVDEKIVGGVTDTLELAEGVAIQDPADREGAVVGAEAVAADSPENSAAEQSLDQEMSATPEGTKVVAEEVSAVVEKYGWRQDQEGDNDPAAGLWESLEAKDRAEGPDAWWDNSTEEIGSSEIQNKQFELHQRLVQENTARIDLKDSQESLSEMLKESEDAAAGPEPELGAQPLTSGSFLMLLMGGLLIGTLVYGAYVLGRRSWEGDSAVAHRAGQEQVWLRPDAPDWPDPGTKETTARSAVVATDRIAAVKPDAVEPERTTPAKVVAAGAVALPAFKEPSLEEEEAGIFDDIDASAAALAVWTERHDTLRKFIAIYQEKLQAFEKPVAGRLGDALRNSQREREQVARELDQVNAEMNYATRRLRVWYGRQQRLQRADTNALRMATEVAAASDNVRAKQQAFQAVTWKYLKDVEAAKYNPDDEALKVSVADLLRQRKDSMEDLEWAITEAITAEVAASEKQIAELTLKRDQLEAQRETLREEEEYVRILLGSDQETKDNLRKRLEQRLAAAQAELREVEQLLSQRS